MSVSLTIEERIRLLTGVGFWRTHEAGGKLPGIFMSDGPHGLRKAEGDIVGGSNPATCFPSASAICAGWDRSAIAKMAEAMADEAIRDDINIILGPGVNMKRSPLCGRNFEYFSEDPYLAGSMASTYINAMQNKGIGACVKHYACNSQETRRHTSNSAVDERALREIYLKAFELVVKNSHPVSIMPSYNLINGHHGTESHKLLTEILRDEWGFDGIAISDWGAVVDFADCVKAGMDLEMPDSHGIHTAMLRKALADGRISEEDIVRASDRIISVVTRLSKSLAEAKAKQGDVSLDTLLKEHEELALELACGSAVLLENDGILPLSLQKTPRLLCIGELASKTRIQGGGSSHINNPTCPNSVEALKALGYDITYVPGYSTGSTAPDAALEAEALAALDQAVKEEIPVLFYCGLTDLCESEGYDRTTLSLPENQLHLYEQMAGRSSKLIAVTYGGSPMDLAFLKDARANLLMYLCGESSGRASALLLTGAKNPSGKLAETFPLRIEDTPCHGNFGKESDNVPYEESIFIGYRYYDTFDKPVLYPFGYGLSYTTFDYSELSVTPLMRPEDPYAYRVSLRIQNTGKVAGAEVVELYVKNPTGDLLREKRKLAAFDKVYLEPGETKEVNLTVNKDSFALYNVNTASFEVPAGTYTLEVGAGLTDIRSTAQISIDSSVAESSFDLPVKMSEFRIDSEAFRKIYNEELPDLDHPRKGSFTVYHSLGMLSKYSLLAKIVLHVARRKMQKENKDRPKDDPFVGMMMHSIKEFTLDGIVIQSGGALDYKVANAIVLDANGHFFKAMKCLMGKNLFTKE